MTETRPKHLLPSEVGGEKQYLPPIQRVAWIENGQEYEAGVHPSRVDAFLDSRRAMFGEIEVLEPLRQQERCLSINECQAVQSYWENGAGIERDTFKQTERMGEEYNELLEATSEYELKPTPERAREAGREAIDVVIIALGIIDRLGLNADDLFREKLERNFHKYPMGAVDSLRATGFSTDEAMAELKGKWNGD
jgi:NTP pyrophosphatase (non-canonical NTP hydrolase)